MPWENDLVARTGRFLTPRRIVGLAVAYVGVSLLLIYVVDVRDAGGLRTTMLALDMDHPAIWYHIYGTRKITEVIQWALLATTAVTASTLGGRLAATGSRGPGAFWCLVGVTAAFMLMEDAGNPRKILADYFVDSLPQYADYIALGFRLVVFGALAAVALYALARYGRSVWPVEDSRWYIILAYSILAVSAVSDVAEQVGFYRSAGLFIHNAVAQGGFVLFPGYTLADQAGMFMDSVWEEGLELVGYSSFLAATIAYWLSVASGRTSSDQSLTPYSNGDGVSGLGRPDLSSKDAAS